MSCSQVVRELRWAAERGTFDCLWWVDSGSSLLFVFPFKVVRVYASYWSVTQCVAVEDVDPVTGEVSRFCNEEAESTVRRPLHNATQYTVLYNELEPLS